MPNDPIALATLGPAETAIGGSECRIGSHRLRVATVTAKDELEVRRLFAEVFEHAQDDRWYRWKYSQGRGEAVGLWDETGRLAAHYAGIPRTLLWRGEPVQAIQIGDVMVTPRLRGLMTRKGPLFQVCSRFFDDRIGAGRRFRLAFGFPNQRHVQLGVKLGLYHDAGRINALRWSAQSHSLPAGWRWSPVTGQVEDEQLSDAWTAMASDMRDCVLGIRDAAYLRWRFNERPDRQYRLFRLHSSEKEGNTTVVIMRFDDSGAELLDLIGPRASFRTAVLAARNEAANAGQSELRAWASPAAAGIIGGDAQVADSGASLAIARASALSDEEVATAPWYWLGGDTDFL